MSEVITTRMGSGERVEMSPSEIKEDLDVGTKDAAQKGEIPELSPEELDQVYEIIAEPGRVVSVPSGSEVIVTDDGVSENLKRAEPDGGSGIHSLGRTTALMAYERGVAADTASMGHEDYSFKPVKGVIELEMQAYYEASQSLTIPLLYGSQPNLGLYFHSDGPFPNPAELMLKGEIKEARESQEAAAEALKADMVFIGGKFNDVGCDGLNFDTAGSSGDPDFWATLEAVRELKSVYPHISIEVGMASEFVLGMHGEVQFDGERLAGMYPHKQLQAVEAAGADIFGVAVNVNTKKSFPWNLARAVTFVKETTRRAHIPVHPNVGMGVCGIPMMVESPIDCVTRTSKALVLIGKADGL